MARRRAISICCCSATAAPWWFSLVAQIGEQVDFLRFPAAATGAPLAAVMVDRAAQRRPRPDRALARSSCSLAPLAFFALKSTGRGEHAAEPANMYLEAVSLRAVAAGFALALTGSFVILSQLKINVTNAYAGSIAWSELFSRLTHSHPAACLAGVQRAGGAALDGDRRLQGAGTDARAVFQRRHRLGRRAGLRSRVNKPLGLRPAADGIQARPLYDINRLASAELTIATIVSISAFYGVFGPTAKALSAFVALAVASSPRPIIAYATDGNITSRASRSGAGRTSKRSMLHLRAPFRARGHDLMPGLCRSICSLCCSLDARCHDLCKPPCAHPAQMAEALGKLLPKRSTPRSIRSSGIISACSRRPPGSSP